MLYGAPKLVVTVRQVGTHTRYHYVDQVGLILPHSRVDFPAYVDHALPAGRYHLVACLHLAGFRILGSCSSSVATLSSGARAANPIPGQTPIVVKASNSSIVLVLVIALVVMLLALAGVLAFFLLGRRKTRVRRTAAEHLDEELEQIIGSQPANEHEPRETPTGSAKR